MPGLHNSPLRGSKASKTSIGIVPSGPDKSAVYLGWLLIILCSVVMIRTAWLCDDAWISFRSIENFVHGYGLVHNPLERVQTFTHPLWVLFLSFLYFLTNQVMGISFTGQLYLITIISSVALTVLALSIFLRYAVRSPQAGLVGLAVLLFSKAFMDYSTSGLENPLSYLLVVLFLSIAYSQQWQKMKPLRRIWLLFFIAGLIGMNRTDLLLLVLPMLGYEFVKHSSKRQAIKAAATAMFPLLLWHLFALFYYGFPWPNSAYAKLGAGISQGSLFLNGVFYYLRGLDRDPVTLTAIVAVLLLAWRDRDRGYWQRRAHAMGIVLYLLYILWIGGDFMVGRFFSVPLLSAVILLSHFEVGWKTLWQPALIVVGLVGFMTPFPTVLSDGYYGHEGPGSCLSEWVSLEGIGDERCHYYSRYGLLSMTRENRYTFDSPYARDEWILNLENYRVEVGISLGIFSYNEPPSTHAIDVYAISDPLLARLPSIDPWHWKPGHFRRNLPEGYLESLETGPEIENLIENESLANYYQPLILITRGDLFDPERLIAIWEFNFGQYDQFLELYIHQTVSTEPLQEEIDSNP